MKRTLSEETKLKISKANKGKPRSPELRKRLSESLKNYFFLNPEKRKNPNEYRKISNFYFSPDHRLKISLKKIGSNNGMWGKRGHLAPNWKGGITTTNKLLRGSFEYRVWRKKVFERDNFTCQICNQRGGYLHADHIKQFAYFPELRFEVSNGRTLCIDCHRKTPTYKKRIYEKN